MWWELLRSTFQICNRILLIIVTMLSDCITIPMTYFKTGHFYLLICFTYFTTPHTLPLATTNLFSVSRRWWCCFLNYTYKWDYVILVFLWVWHISLSIMPSESMCVVKNGKISCFYGWIYSYIYMCVCIYIYIYIHSIFFIHQCTYRLFSLSHLELFS